MFLPPEAQEALDNLDPEELALLLKMIEREGDDDSDDDETDDSTGDGDS